MPDARFHCWTVDPRNVALKNSDIRSCLLAVVHGRLAAGSARAFLETQQVPLPQQALSKGPATLRE
jgi:hypothetical protein